MKWNFETGVNCSFCSNTYTLVSAMSVISRSLVKERAREKGWRFEKKDAFCQECCDKGLFKNRKKTL